jgi:hypothetical protein
MQHKPENPRGKKDMGRERTGRPMHPSHGGKFDEERQHGPTRRPQPDSQPEGHDEDGVQGDQYPGSGTDDEF